MAVNDGERRSPIRKFVRGILWLIIGVSVGLFAEKSVLLIRSTVSAAELRKAGGETLPKYLKSAELYDPKTGTFTRTRDMIAARQGGSATILKNGRVLFVGGLRAYDRVEASAELYDPRTATFAKTGNLEVGRESQTATLLNDGEVLIAGGDNLSAPPTMAELYDPTTGRFERAGRPSTARADAAAALLPSGEVLIAGGWDPGDGPDHGYSSAELYNPKTKQFFKTGKMTQDVSNATAITLEDGNILIIGGRSGGYAVAPIESYNPKSRTFAAAGDMGNHWLFDCTSTYLSDGKVLVTGCYDGQRAFLYDPNNRQIIPTGAMIEPRSMNSATLLANGNVLVAGGISQSEKEFKDYRSTASAELYDPALGKFSLTGSMTVPRSGHRAVLLKDGRVLIAGGSD